jgi:hypothetical protein
VCCECPSDIEVPGRPVDARQDARVVPANLEEKEPLEIHVAIDGGDHHPLWSYYSTVSARVQVHSFADLDVHWHRILPVLRQKKNRTERGESGCMPMGFVIIIKIPDLNRKIYSNQ